MNDPGKQILDDAVESDWGLFTIPESLRKFYPGQSDEQLIETSRGLVRRLVKSGLIRLYWLSTRPASESEANVVRSEFRVGNRRPIVMPVTEDIPPTDSERILAMDSTWRPPVEDRHVAFEATDAGREVYYGSSREGT